MLTMVNLWLQTAKMSLTRSTNFDGDPTAAWTLIVITMTNLSPAEEIINAMVVMFRGMFDE